MLSVGVNAVWNGAPLLGGGLEDQASQLGGMVQLNVDTVAVMARCFNGAGGLNVHNFQIPQHQWPTIWNASTLDDSREHKALWKAIAPIQRDPHLFQEVDWYADQFRHGFQPSLVPI